MSAPRSTAVHIYPADMRREGRIVRIAQHLLQRGYFAAVELAGIGDGTLPRTQTLPGGVGVRRFAVSKRIRAVSVLLYWALWNLKLIFHYARRSTACVNAHAVTVLPAGWLIATLAGCPLVYQPHELETEMDFRGGAWAGKRFRQVCERLFIHRAQRVVLVSEPIGEWYRKAYDLETVSVVRNMPAGGVPAPLERDYYAKRFGFPPQDLVFQYQGLIAANRGIEALLEAFARVPPDRHFVVLGYGSLIGKVEAAARRLPNVHLHPEVPPDELPRFAAAADVGVVMIENAALTYELCCPGKYCEYLSGHRPVLLSDFLWLSREVRSYDCGWPVSLEPQTLADAIAGIDRDEIARKTEGARRWAAENNWQTEQRVLDAVYSGLAVREIGAPGRT